jgi:hypothetical protein
MIHCIPAGNRDRNRNRSVFNKPKTDGRFSNRSVFGFPDCRRVFFCFFLRIFVFFVSSFRLKYLSLASYSVSSATSERLFSTSGNIVSSKRTSLESSTVASLVLKMLMLLLIGRKTVKKSTFFLLFLETIKKSRKVYQLFTIFIYFFSLFFRVIKPF